MRIDFTPVSLFKQRDTYASKFDINIVGTTEQIVSAKQFILGHLQSFLSSGEFLNQLQVCDVANGFIVISGDTSLLDNIRNRLMSMVQVSLAPSQPLMPSSTLPSPPISTEFEHKSEPLVITPAITVAAVVEQQPTERKQPEQLDPQRTITSADISQNQSKKRKKLTDKEAHNQQESRRRDRMREQFRNLERLMHFPANTQRVSRIEILSEMVKTLTAVKELAQLLGVSANQNIAMLMPLLKEKIQALLRPVNVTTDSSASSSSNAMLGAPVIPTTPFNFFTSPLPEQSLSLDGLLSLPENPGFNY